MNGKSNDFLAMRGRLMRMATRKNSPGAAPGFAGLMGGDVRLEEALAKLHDKPSKNPARNEEPSDPVNEATAVAEAQEPAHRAEFPGPVTKKPNGVNGSVATTVAPIEPSANQRQQNDFSASQMKVEMPSNHLNGLSELNNAYQQEADEINVESLERSVFVNEAPTQVHAEPQYEGNENPTYLRRSSVPEAFEDESDEFEHDDHYHAEPHVPEQSQHHSAYREEASAFQRPPEHVPPRGPKPNLESDAGTGLVSARSAEATMDAFNKLTDQLMEKVGAPNQNVELTTRELLKPMLQNWLDQNLPTVVENLVREEIERVVRRGGR